MEASKAGFQRAATARLFGLCVRENEGLARKKEGSSAFDFLESHANLFGMTRRADCFSVING
jgi:hypothetical protein